MKKIVLPFVIIWILLLLGTVLYDTGTETITVLYDAGTGTIEVNHKDSTVCIHNNDAVNCSDFKVIVKKGSEKYIYNIFSSKEVLPLQMGNGKYAVGLYKRIYGSKYRLISLKVFTLNTNENSVYLASTQNVKWDSHSTTTQLAYELTKNLEIDKEKLEVIYQYVVKNISYDYEKATTITSRYNPRPQRILEEGKGICYDYASLTAAMLRSEGIPTKLVKGYSKMATGYHSWNEVLIDDEWIVVDATLDAVYLSYGISLFYKKNSEDYLAEKVY